MANQTLINIVKDKDFKAVRSTVVMREGWYWKGLDTYAGYALPLSHHGWMAEEEAAQHACEVLGNVDVREQFLIFAHRQSLTEGVHFALSQSTTPGKDGWRWKGLGVYRIYDMALGRNGWPTKAEAFDDALNVLMKLEYSYKGA